MNKLNKILRVDSESRSFLAVQNDEPRLGSDSKTLSKKTIPDEHKRVIRNLALDVIAELRVGEARHDRLVRAGDLRDVRRIGGGRPGDRATGAGHLPTSCGRPGGRAGPAVGPSGARGGRGRWLSFHQAPIAPHQ